MPAAHNELEKDAWGRHKFLGYIVEAGPWTIYHSGDTVRYDGMIHDFGLLNGLAEEPAVRSLFAHAAAELKHYLH